jgi:hypothetical protein
MRIAIAIPYYKGGRFIRSLLRSLDVSSDRHLVTVFIVDNCPLRIDPELKRAKFNFDLEVIEAKPGLGYGKACNLGFAAAKSGGFDYLLVLNQDGFAEPGLISGLVDSFSYAESMAVAVPLEYNYETGMLNSFFVQYYISQCPEMVADSISGLSKPCYEITRFPGSCFMLKLDVYPFDYLFDPAFHMYFEDEELSIRVQRLHFKAVLVRGLKFYHHHMHVNDEDNRHAILKWKVFGEYLLALKQSKSFLKDLFQGIYVTFLGVLSNLFKLRIRMAYYIFLANMKLIGNAAAIYKRWRNEQLVFVRNEKRESV